MIDPIRANLFDPMFDDHVRVIPVNCIGVMGKGLAKDAREHWPALNAPYQQLCRDKALRPGEAVKMKGIPVILAATKDHWKQPSQLAWIEQLIGISLVAVAHTQKKPLVIPALGCGLGGLNWKDVLQLIEQHHRQYPETTIWLQPDGFIR